MHSATRERGRVFLAKLDLQNAYWRIRLPRLVEESLRGGGGFGESVRLYTFALWLELQPSYLPAPRPCSGAACSPRRKSGGGYTWTIYCSRPAVKGDYVRLLRTAGHCSNQQGSLWERKARFRPRKAPAALASKSIPQQVP